MRATVAGSCRPLPWLCGVHAAEDAADDAGVALPSCEDGPRDACGVAALGALLAGAAGLALGVNLGVVAKGELSGEDAPSGPSCDGVRAVPPTDMRRDCVRCLPPMEDGERVGVAP